MESMVRFLHDENFSKSVENLSEWDYLEFYGNDSFYTEHDFDQIFREFKRTLYTTENPVTIVLITCYVVVFVFALLGNMMVLIVILANKHMRTSITNSYLLNLAIADLLVTLVCIPLTVGETVYKVWIYGHFLCKATNYLQGICISASVLTIMALSLDRYMAIRHPVRSRRTSSAACVRITIVCIWLVSGVIMVPLAIVRSMTWHHLGASESLGKCGEHWSSLTLRTAFDTFLFIFIYILPGTVVIFSYSSTGCRLMTTDNILHRTDSDGCHGSRVLAGRRRLARMLLALAILFALSWMPYHAMILYSDYTNPKETSMVNYLSFALLFGHSHSAQNPVLYCFMNRNFKHGMAKVWKCGSHNVTESSIVRGDTWRRKTRRTIVLHHDGNANKRQFTTPSPDVPRWVNAEPHPSKMQKTFQVKPVVDCSYKSRAKSTFLMKPIKSDTEPAQMTETTPLTPVIQSPSHSNNYEE